MRTLTANVVLIGGVHDPGRVDRAFLKDNGVVPDNFALVPQAANETSDVGTRLFFHDSWRLLVGRDGLHVFKDAVATDADLRLLGSIVTAYVAAQPHIVYAALGTDFHVFLPQPSASRWIKDHFLPRDAVFAEAVCPSLTLRYNAAVPPLTLSFHERPARVVSELEMVQCDANLHRDLANVDQPATIAAAMANLVSDANYVDAQLGAIVAVPSV